MSVANPTEIRHSLLPYFKTITDMSTAQYSQAPPQYGSVGGNKRTSLEQDPLLEQSSTTKKASHGDVVPNPGGSWADDASDDFDIGTTVSSSSVAIRQAFVRKVYSMLLVMLASTWVVPSLSAAEKVTDRYGNRSVVAGTMRMQAAQNWIQSK